MKILLTFIGRADIKSFNKKGYHPERFGPILKILQQREFDKLYLLYDKKEFLKTASKILLYCRDKSKGLDVNYKEVKIIDPTEYNTLYPVMYSVIKEILQENSEADCEYTISLTSGTPAMHSCWFLLERGGTIKADLIQISRDGEIKEVNFRLDDFPKIKNVETAKVKLTKINRENKKISKKLALKGFEILGESPKIEELKGIIKKVAPTNAIVLITGETGTGKELVARNIHAYSKRREKKFVSLNCASLPTNLVESELFGHEKGAFTGANTSREGKFIYADQGTLFLDEIGDMELESQAKLLKVLDSNVVQKLGTNKERTVDVRLIAATNRDLMQAVEEGSFREDLYHRLNEYFINCPPLKELKNDIIMIGEEYLKKFLQENKKYIPTPIFNGKAVNKLKSYVWPGNIRELINTMRRSAIDYQDFGCPFSDCDISLDTNVKKDLLFKPGETLEEQLKPFRCSIIKKSLKEHKMKKSKVKDVLDISYPTLNKYIKECEIET